jgi:hypothetical protein
MTTTTPIYKKKKFYIPAIIITILIVFRILLPQILLHQANKYLANFSPTYYMHMEDLDISILRGAYTFESITGNLRGDDKKFLDISVIDVSLAWRHLLKGKIVTDVVAENVDFLFLQDMSKLSPPKKEAKDVKETLFPVKVESVDLRDARVVFEEYPSLDETSRLKIERINGKITNLTPDKNEQLSDFNLTAALQGSSETIFIGQLNLLKQPMAWDVDIELNRFDLAKLNPILTRKLPLTFTSGKLDLYAEMKNEGKVIKGYIKPFIQDIDVVANKEHFKGIKHFGIEVLTALGNLILRDSQTKSVATYLDFTYDGKFNLDTGLAIEKAFEHGFSRKLKRGIEDTYHIDKPKNENAGKK